MKIGWLSFDSNLNDLIDNLLFAKHEVFYLENKKDNIVFEEKTNLHKVNLINEIIVQSDILFTYFKNIDDLYKFYTYPNGIFDLTKQINKKIICIDLSLSSANLVKKVLSKNPLVHFLEAPIIFSENFHNKTMKIMPVSGRKYIYDKVDSLFADLGIEHYYAGGFGSAQIISGANNILKSVVALGFFEAVSYAKGNDLDLNLLIDSVKNGAGGSVFLKKFFDFFKKDNFESLNKNFIGTANQIKMVLNDNKKNKDEFLLTKIINGILNNEKNQSNDLDLNFLTKFYNLDLNSNAFKNQTEYEKNINTKTDEFQFLIDDEKDFFEFKDTDKINENNDKEKIYQKIENLSLNKENNLNEINDLNSQQINDNEELGTDFYSENFFNIDLENKEKTQNNNQDLKNISKDQKLIYDSPESLKETKLNDDLKNHFANKSDENYDSLSSKEKDFIEPVLPSKKNINNNKKDFVENFFLENSPKLSSDNNKNKDDDIDLGINIDNKWNFNSLYEKEENKSLNKSKVLIFDLDGTLLNSDHKVNPENIKALNLASEKGNKIIIATGRCYDQIIETVNSIGKIVDFAIINNGALIHDYNKNFLIQNANPLSEDIKSFFIKTVFENKISFLAYSELDLYAFVFGYDIEKFRIYINENTIDLSNLSEKDLEEYLNNHEINIYNFSAYQKDMSESDWIEMFKSFKNQNKCNITSALKGYIDIYSPTSKYFGYLKLKEIINFDDNDVYFFGDSNNDYDLLAHLPHSIAMGNASKKVKDVAKYVIGDNDSNAISEFLKNTGLI